MAGTHAHKSPSGAKRLHACSGALALVATLPDEMKERGGEQARIGTVAHFVLEKSLREGKLPSEFEGRLVRITRDKGGNETGCSMLRTNARVPKNPDERALTYEVDPEMVANVDIAFNYVIDRCEALGVPVKSLLLEQRTNPVPDRDDTTGTADITVDAWPIMLEVVDFKNGRITVEHEDNPQLLAYLAGRAHDTGWNHDAYRITVVQPNGRHEEGKVRCFDIPADRLRAFVDKHRAAAERADEAADALSKLDNDPRAEVSPEHQVSWAEAYLKAGAHCDDSFCEARLACPAYKAWCQMQAKLDFAEPAPEAREATLHPVHAEALEMARDILERAPYMRAMMALANRFVLAEAKAGRMPEGFKFVYKVSKRQWAPGEDGETPAPGQIVSKLVADGFIPADKQDRLWTQPGLITGPQAEKLVPSKLRAEFSAQYLIKPPGGLKLVPETAPGEPVPVSPADDFNDGDDDDDY